MERRIIDARESADSVGGVVTCIVRGCPVGLGEPVFGRLNQRLGSAMLSINAVKGFEIGDGFDMARCRGSQVMDSWVADAEDPRGIRAVANHSGGIQGGISNGEDIVMRIAFKPIATIFQPIATVNDKLEPVTLQARGRHDPCVVPRAVPVVEAMAAMTIFDALLIDRTRRI
jgi:chorismate synthase